MAWEIEYTDEFGEWWDSLDEQTQNKMAAGVELLERHGPNLNFPYSSDVKGSKHRKMRELRIQFRGHPFRILYAFDPRRCVILLIGGDKTGQDNWYEVFVPLADIIYDVHLREIARDIENG